MQTLIELFELNGLIPPDLILWLTIGSDLLIALAYYSIALGLVYFIRQGKDFSHPWLFVMLAIFFIACGTMHLLAVTTIWIRLYWLEIFIKTFTALTSIVAAISIFWLIRLPLKFPSQKTCQQKSRAVCNNNWIWSK